MTNMTLRREDDFSVTVLRHGDRAMVYVSGDIDLSTEDQLRQVLASLAGDRVRKVVVDLRDVGLFGSDALRVLAEAQRAADVTGASLILAAVPPAVLRILEITGMSEVFDIRRLTPA